MPSPTPGSDQAAGGPTPPAAMGLRVHPAGHVVEVGRPLPPTQVSLCRCQFGFLGPGEWCSLTVEVKKGGSQDAQCPCRVGDKALQWASRQGGQRAEASCPWDSLGDQTLAEKSKTLGRQ